MSQGRGENNRDTISLRKRPGLHRIITKKEAEKPKDVEIPKEKEKDGEKEKVEQTHESPPATGGRGIRTRLSTGSIHMNGTYTVAVAKEIENNQNLMHKDPDLDQAVTGRTNDSWTAEEKLKIVDFAEKFGNRAAGRRFNVGESNIRSWRKLEDELTSMPSSKRANREVSTPLSSSATTTSGSGKKRSQAGTVDGIHAQGPGGQTVPPKRRKIGRNDGSGEDNRNDYFCWLCHKEGTVICCELCPRVYHTKCLNLGLKLPKDWVCPECEKIMRAECIDTRSKAMSMISIDTLCTLLKYALERMTHQGSDPFMKPVDLSAVPYYTDYIYNAMDLGQLERNIKKKMYGCTEAFLADAKWILHNCIIFNGTHHKLTSSAKMIIKICKHEMNEIELCPDCYWNSCVRKNDEWFSETCRTPHTLVWAKLKGYPFWPAKALREEDDQVDVRFFGAHDRSWVPTSQVYMLSRDIPTPAKNKRGGFENAMEELEIHIKKIREKFGHFEYASFRMPYDKNHVYFHNKMKQPFRKVRQAARNQKFSPKQKSYPVKHVYTNKTLSDSSPTKVEKQSVMLKTADAVRNKYSTMITTRRAVNEATQSRTETKGQAITSDKTDLGVGQTNRVCVQSVSTTVSPTNLSPPIVIPTNLIKVVKLPSSQVNTIIVKQGDVERKVIIQQPETQAKVSIVDKVQNKIKQMNADNLDEEADASQPKLQDNNRQSGSVISEDKDKKMQIDSTDVISDQVTDKVLEERCNTNATSSLIDKMDTDDSDIVMESSHHKESSVSPSKEIYLANLQKTIQSCKEKLGLSDDSVLSDEIVDDDEEEEEDMHDQNVDDEKDNLCDESKKNNISKEPDVSETNANKSVTVSSANDLMENNEKSNSTVVKSAAEVEDLPEMEEKTETEKKETNLESRHSADQTSSVQEKNKLEVIAEQKESPNREHSQDSTVHDDQRREHSKDKTDQQQESIEHSSIVSKDGSEEIPKDKKEVSSPPQKNVQSDKNNSNLIVLEANSQPSEFDSKDTDVSNKGTVQPAIMEVDNESNLVTEVETDSDTDNLVMDLSEDDQSIRTSKPQTLTPTKPSVRISPPVVKPSTSDKFKQIDLPGLNKVVIVKQSSSSGENKSKSLSSSSAKPFTAKSPNSRKSPAMVSKRVPSAEFFQNAVEKTMKSPNSSLEKSMDTESDLIEESTSDSVVPAHSEIISKFTKKLMGSIQGTFEMMCSEFISQELQPKNVTKDLQAEIQKIRWEQHQQILELKHNFQLTMAEMKSCWEAEKQRIVSEINSMNSKDKEKAINETKKKQWCASCGKEAIFYCCWNTSYCDYPCQQAHWPKHMPTCMQTQQAQASANEKESCDKDSQSAATPSSVKTSAQDPDKVVETSASGSKSVTGNMASSSASKQTTPVLGSGESPIDVDMERPNLQQWEQTSVQPVRQDCTPYMCPPQQQAPPPGVVQVPQGGLQFTSIVPSPGASTPLNQEQMMQKKKTNCHGWSEQSMSEAYNAVMTGGMSVNKAAKVFQVPRIRLADRIAALGKSAQFPPGNGVQQIPQGTSNPQMLSGSSHIVTSQPILQYVQSPQSIISLPPSSLPVQQFTPQMGMQTVQVQGQPTPTGLVQNQQAIVQNRSLVQPNSSVLFPMNVAGGVMPGNLVFSQSGPRPYQIPRPY